jgi:ABC-type multidrug transport system fused ATPase/permease subunit
LEVIKVRFMSQDGSSLRTHNHGQQYKSVWHAFNIMRHEEGWRIFFRGAHVAAVAGGISHGVYMGSYRYLLETNKKQSTSTTSPFATLFVAFQCSILANFVVAFVTNPIWFIKTRMQIHDDFSEKTQTTSSKFRSAVYCLKKTLQNEKSLTVFWRGTSAQLLLSFPSSLHFPIYEMLRLSLAQQKSAETNSSKSFLNFSVSVVCCNLIAKSFVTILSHPFTLLRTRLQDERARQQHQEQRYYNTLRQAILSCYRNEGGLKGFWRGLAPSMLQVVPRSIVHVLLYEIIMSRSKKTN